MKTSNALALFACLSAYSAAAAADPALQEVGAKAFVEAGLKDPSSAQYRGLTHYSDGVVCGEYNAKNSYGGYTGYSWFIYSVVEYRFSSMNADARDVRILCKNGSPAKFALHALLPVTRQLTDLEYKCRDQIYRPTGTDNCQAGHDLVAQYKTMYPNTFVPKFNP